MIVNRFLHICNHQNPILLQIKWQLMPIHIVINAIGYFPETLCDQQTEIAKSEHNRHIKYDGKEHE